MLNFKIILYGISELFFKLVSINVLGFSSPH